MTQPRNRKCWKPSYTLAPREHGGIVTGVNYNSAFEARSQFIIGLTKKAPYSLAYLDGPPRVVIDFQI